MLGLGKRGCTGGKGFPALVLSGDGGSKPGQARRGATSGAGAAHAGATPEASGTDGGAYRRNGGEQGRRRCIRVRWRQRVMVASGARGGEHPCVRPSERSGDAPRAGGELRARAIDGSFRAGGERVWVITATCARRSGRAGFRPTLRTTARPLAGFERRWLRDGTTFGPSGRDGTTLYAITIHFR